VLTADGTRLPCRLHGRRISAVCGDRVRWAHAQPGDSFGTVYEILPREHTLERLTSQGDREPVVSNLTQLVAVIAPRPTPDWFIVDRYLAGAAWCGISAVVAFNKAELGVSADAEAELECYALQGYRILRASSRGAPGIGALAECLKDSVSVLVGQSGTGKSSLLNALVPEAHAVTQEISAATEEGRHTTTHSVLHHLSTGGDLIDSPGVRDFAPPLPQARDVASGFIEIATAAAGCRFQDCLHAAEPGCAVRDAVSRGTIRSRRFDSFRRLLGLAREMNDRFPSRRGGGRPPPRVR
jgi:ribosome biogenesis GTPase / thiamine phosphate phosphatase